MLLTMEKTGCGWQILGPDKAPLPVRIVTPDGKVRTAYYRAPKNILGIVNGEIASKIADLLAAENKAIR